MGLCPYKPIFGEDLLSKTTGELSHGLVNGQESPKILRLAWYLISNFLFCVAGILKILSIRFVAMSNPFSCRRHPNSYLKRGQARSRWLSLTENTIYFLKLMTIIL